MIILIDFENTHGSGFQGVEYLDEKDTLVVYYSDENSAVSRGLVDDLKEKNVHVRMVKLLKQHSNALDMYIASTTGMFLDTGEKICIVSKDRGYAAVRDFWHSLRGAEILLGETIEECFLHSEGNDDERIRRAKERSEKILLTESFDTMNNIPTKPTLSRSNYWRRKKQISFDLSKNLNPVEILPNPLAKPGLEEGSASDEEAAVDGMALLQELADSLKIPEEASPMETDGKRTKAEEKGKEKQGRLESAVEKKTDVRKKTEDTEIHKEEGQKAKKKPGNQLRFVYDPVKKAMIKVSDTESEREESPVPAFSKKDETFPLSGKEGNEEESLPQESLKKQENLPKEIEELPKEKAKEDLRIKKEDIPNEKEEGLQEKEAGNKKKSTGRRRRTSAKKEAMHQEESIETPKLEEKTETTASPKTREKRKGSNPHKGEERGKGKDNNPSKEAAAVKKAENKQENKQESKQEIKQGNKQENMQEDKKEYKPENSAEGTGEKKTRRRRRTVKKESPKV